MQRNNNIVSKIITLNFNQKNYQFSTEIIKPVNTFYTEVCSYLQIDPNNFNLYYNNKKLVINNNKTLSEIIKSNEDPYFQIMSKKQKTKTPHKPNLRYDSISMNGKESSSSKKLPNYLTSSINNKKSNINNKNYINNYNNNDSGFGVIISQIPSVQNIKNILANFNNKQNNNNNMSFKTNNYFDKKRGILTVISNNSVRIDFQDEMVLNEFISYISFMKYENSYFKNMIIQKDNSNIKKNIRNLSYSHKNMLSYLHNFNKKYDYNNIKTFRNEKNNNLTININDVIAAVKQNELNNELYHGLTLKRDEEDEIIKDYYKQQMYLRNSSPYISEEEKRILEAKENKKHFYQHKNFVTSVGKYSMKPNFIPNYVGMTPSENPKTHLFRNVDKKKWISNKGFHV